MDVTADRILIVASPTAAPLCTAVERGKAKR